MNGLFGGMFRGVRVHGSEDHLSNSSKELERLLNR